MHLLNSIIKREMYIQYTRILILQMKCAQKNNKNIFNVSLKGLKIGFQAHKLLTYYKI